MIALKELKDCRHGLHQNVEALRGCTVKLYQDNMTVVGALRKMSSKCPELSEGSRHVVLAVVHPTRALVPGRGDPGHTGVHGPV